jgi:hypothetical protein
MKFELEVVENKRLIVLYIILNLPLPNGGVHMRRRPTIGFSEVCYCASDSVQCRRTEFWRNMMDLEKLKRM